ncbi:mucin-16-like [Loxodonta africana]|uniref:mucin-16-like n=1 Tax=Loxodonta africana TaxID=9785 RepID=UPI0030D01AC6
MAGLRQGICGGRWWLLVLLVLSYLLPTVFLTCKMEMMRILVSSSQGMLGGFDEKIQTCGSEATALRPGLRIDSGWCLLALPADARSRPSIARRGQGQASGLVHREASEILKTLQGPSASLLLSSTELTGIQKDVSPRLTKVLSGAPLSCPPPCHQATPQPSLPAPQPVLAGKAQLSRGNDSFRIWDSPSSVAQAPPRVLMFRKGGPDESVVITTRELPREGVHGGTTWSTSDPTSPVTTTNLDLGPDESVVITTRELPREGAHGGTTWSTSDPTSPVTTINLDLEMTTRMSKGSEDVSMSRPPPVEETSSSFSLSAFPATTSPSPVLSTLQGYSPSSLLPVTPVFTSDLVKTADMLGTSLEPGTSSPPNLSSTSGDTLTTFEATKDMEAIHTSTNTVVATAGATSSGHKGHSSVLAPSEPTRVTSSVGTTFIMGETSVSRSLPEYSETTGIEAESTSSLTHGLQETRTSLDSSLDQWTPVYVSTGAATEVPRTEAISFSRRFVPGSTHFKMSPNTPTERNTNPFISRLRSVSSGITFATTTGPPRATSQGVFTLDTSATNSWAGISSVLTKGFPHSEMTTLRDGHSQTTLRDDRQDVLSPLSVEEASSLSSMAPTPATTSPSSVSSMLQEDSPSSPHPGTSVLTSGPVKTTTNLGTSLEPDHSSLPNVSSTTGKIPSTSEDTTDTEAIHPSTDTTGATAGTTSSEHVSLSLVPAHSEPFMVTSPVVITSSMVDFTLSTSQLASPENTRIETKPPSSFSNGVSETNTYQGTNSPTETYNVLSHVSTGVATTELSKTEIPSSDRALIPASTQSTWPPEIFSGTSSRPSISPVMTGFLKRDPFCLLKTVWGHIFTGYFHYFHINTRLL